MTPQLSVEGAWPGSLTLCSGWSRARVRPWNDAITDPMVRLERGGTGFLRAVCEHLSGLGAKAIYSPALYPGTSRLWRRSDFDPFAELEVMECDLALPVPWPDDAVTPTENPDWEAILRIDRAAFEGFWGMNRLGLSEALQANRVATLLTVSDNGEPAGYAIVGAQWGVAYLHRIAVDPETSGRGHGGCLLAAAMRWGREHGARSMVLNVRTENEAARGLYYKHGFVDTGSRIVVLRHLPERLLN